MEKKTEIKRGKKTFRIVMFVLLAALLVSPVIIAAGCSFTQARFGGERWRAVPNH